MKTKLILGFLGLNLLLSACSTPDATKDSPENTETTIVGRWKLSKEEQKPVTGDGVKYENQPTQVVLNIQKSGYFVLYDTFIDPSWKKKGLPLIQERSKGQWIYDGKKLTLNHNMKDTSYSEIVTVTEVNETTLKTQGNDKKSNTYKTYGK